MLKKIFLNTLRVFILFLLSVTIITVQGCDNASQKKSNSSSEIKHDGETLSIEQNVTFYHPYRDGISGKEAVVEFEADSTVENKIMKVLTLLFSDSTKSGGYLPEGIKVLDVFTDSEAIVYVNLNDTVGASGKIGVSAEREFISSLALTVLKNFPETSGVKILIGNEERKTLAGHINISKPFYLLSSEGTAGETIF